MSESQDAGSPRLPEPDPDPRFREYPIPHTVDEAVARIVEWVYIVVGDIGGPEYEFDVPPAEKAFTEHWGRFIEKQLKRVPNPWPEQWKSIVHIAKIHGTKAVELAREAGHKPVSTHDFVEAGKYAATQCMLRFGRAGLRGCWCNDC